MRTTSYHAPLVVADRRSAFAALSIGWRFSSAQEALSQGKTFIAHTQKNSGTAPVSFEWSTGEGFLGATAVLPAPQAEHWLKNLLSFTPPPVLSAPTISVVAPPDVAADLEHLATVPGTQDSAAQPPGNDPSSLKKTTVSGFEQLLISGEDPAEKAGKAATFLGICALAAGPGTLLFDTLKGLHEGALLQINRTLPHNVPRINWQLIVPKRGALPLLETTLSSLEGNTPLIKAEKIDQAKNFGLGNLRRPWRSPGELAQALVQYETMGWGGNMILDPESSLHEVSEEDLQNAVEGLIRPLREVLGRT